MRKLEKSDYPLILKKGHRLTNHFFNIRFIKTEYDSAKIGWILPKRKIAKAVKRNQIKRLIKQSYAQYELKLTNKMILVNPTYQTETAEKFELKQALDSLFYDLINQGK